MYATAAPSSDVSIFIRSRQWLFLEKRIGPPSILIIYAR